MLAPWLQSYLGNPSSSHAFGRRAAQATASGLAASGAVFHTTITSATVVYREAAAQGLDQFVASICSHRTSDNVAA